MGNGGLTLLCIQSVLKELLCVDCEIWAVTLFQGL